MVAPSFSMLLMLFTMVGQAGNHLLDFVSTDAYWKSKGVAVTVDTMLGELAPPAAAADLNRPIAELASPDPAIRAAAAKTILGAGQGAIAPLEQAVALNDPQLTAAAKDLLSQIRLANKSTQVRRLMAMRTLGELQDERGLKALAAPAESKDDLERDYARRAASALRKQHYAQDGPTAQQRLADALALPAETRAVLQQSMLSSQPQTLEQMLAQMPPMPGMPVVDKARMRDEITAMLVRVAEEIGDVRIDTVTAGLSGDPGPGTGFVVVVGRGAYDATAASAALKKMEIPAKAVGGVEVFSLGPNAALILLDGTRVALLAGPSMDKLPIDELLANLQGAKAGLAGVPEMKALLEAAETKQPLWGVAKMTDTYKQAPVLKALDTVSVVGVRDGASVKLNVRGTGTDAEAIKAATADADAFVQMGLANLRPVAGNMPMLKPFQALLETVKVEAKDRTMELTAKFEGDTSSLGMMFFFFGAQRSTEPQKVEAVKPR